jgi:hypothetical protein
MERRREWGMERDVVSPEVVRKPGSKVLEGPSKYGDLAKGHAVESERGDLACDPVRFFGGMAKRAAAERGWTVLRRSQRFFLVRVDVATDDAGRELDDGRRRAVVRRQFVASRSGPTFLESERVLDLRAPKAVDRLVFVGDAENVAVAAGDQLEQLLLCDVGVLVLVDQDVPEPFGVDATDVFVLCEEPDRLTLEAAVVEPPVEVLEVVRADGCSGTSRYSSQSEQKASASAASVREGESPRWP